MATNKESTSNRDATLPPAPSPSAGTDTTAAKSIEKQAWDLMRTCYDPEIPVNMVDLGLIYSCQVAPLPGGGHRIDVTMTLTAPGCGMSEYLKAEIQARLSTIPGVKAANVEVVFDPPWSQEMMSDAAKLRLGLL